MPVTINSRSVPEKDKPFFNYNEIADAMWSGLINKAHDHFNIYFDHENDEAAGSGKVFTVEVSRPPENIYPLKYEFKCRMHKAGGDWQEPSCYFRCQITSGSFYDIFGRYPGNIGTHKNSCFVVIPGISDGNSRLVAKDNGAGLVAMDHNYQQDPPELDERKAWKFLEDYLHTMVEDYITQVEAKRLSEKEKRTAMAKDVLLKMFVKNRNDYGI